MLFSFFSEFSDRPIEMIEHPVDDNSGDGDVEPDRKCPSCDLFVKGEALPPGAIDRDQGKRNNGCRQNGMRSQQGEIKRPDRSVTLKVNNPAEEMVAKVKNQKDG